MPLGAGFSTLTAEWVDGSLVIYDSSHTAVVTLNSSGLNWVGGVTISSAILTGNVTISTAITGDLTISSGPIKYNGRKTNNIAANYSLTCSDSGCVFYATTCDIIITLPGVASTGVALFYTIYVTNTTAGQVVIKTTTTELVKGGIVGSTGADILSNTGATHKDGDMVSLIGNPASTSWSMVGLVGTWASTT